MTLLLILTEAGRDLGYGHLTRCRSIAAAFSQRGYQTKLIVQGDGVQLEASEQSMCWGDLGPVIEEAVRNADIVVIDSLIVGNALVVTIQGLNPKTVVVDDYMHHTYVHGVVIDWTVGAEIDTYQHRERQVHYLLGSKYCPLRPPFWVPRDRVFRAEPKRILVTLGGSDIRQLTCPLVRKLIEHFPAIEIHAVVGGGVKSTDDYPRLMNQGAHLHFDLDATAMRDLMDAADLAISAGGQTLYELACRGLPSVAINLIDNQTADIRGFSTRGFAVAAGRWDDVGLLDRVEGCVTEIWQGSAREAASAVGRSLVDGQGGFRLAAEIEQAFHRSR